VFGVQHLAATAHQFGWTVGVGFELGLTPNWSAKAEYDYLNFGSKNLILQDTTLVNFKQDFNQVKVGVNYRFGPSSDEVAVARLPVKAAPVAAFNWTGVYAGVAVADRLSTSSWDTSLLSDGAGGFLPPDITTTPVSFFSSALQGRLYSGYNWHFAGNWVTGFEGDIGAGSSSRMTRAGIPGTFGNGVNGFVGIEGEQADSVSVRMGWDGTVRGKIGMLVAPSLLFYGSAGAAFQRVSVSASCDNSFNSACFFGAKSQTFSTVRTGWTAGAGLEGVLTGNWMGKVEVRYADFGRINNTFFAGTGDDIVTSVRVQTYTALAGIAYKFGPGAVVAKY
jgi:outer membrane immunogenic protein